ncbi:Trypsin [Corynebacterium mustelae]|uniref:Trypsin n=1 Tax=Corynebacterium mustelae TaxID=571915 RepID=A0A0G3GWM4_9CORY|nr:serine protease [Corynebacterium mustelae]AKK05576.1 Trypsin [Corynebacterium mustelae]
MKRRMSCQVAAVVIAVTQACSLIHPALALAGGQIVPDDDPQGRTVARIISGNRFCTGVAVARHWVLTAAHCTNQETGQIYSITIGNTYTGPTYTGDMHYIAPHSDVALIRVPSGLNLDGYAELADTMPGAESRGEVYGWGNGTGEILHSAHTTIKNTYRIDAYNRGYFFIVENDIPAVTLPGDSGGPVFYEGKVIGINASYTGHERAHHCRTDTLREWVINHVYSFTPESDEIVEATNLKWLALLALIPIIVSVVTAIIALLAKLP